MSLADAPGVAAGTDLGVLTCDADVRAGGRVVAEATLAVSRAVAPQLLREVESVRALYASLFGPIGLHQVPWTDWGRVGLPLPRTLDAAGLAAEVAREGLATPEQRERAVVAYGGTYAHFLGSDAPGSDAWGSPDAVRSLLRLAKGWHDHCLASGGDEARCLLQIGDLAWYNATKPDPLGHRDHFAGDCVDIRLFRSDGSRYEAWWNRPDDRTGAMAYDAARTTDFLRFATANAPIREAFFNDPAALAAVPGLKPYRGHDDHMHLCFTTGG